MADQIHITFPDGASREFPVGVTALDVAKSIGPRLASEAVAAKTGDKLVDLSTKLEADGPIQFIMPSSPEGLEILRHSSAHLLAAAVTELFPDAHPGIGPPPVGDGEFEPVIIDSVDRFLGIPVAQHGPVEVGVECFAVQRR